MANRLAQELSPYLQQHAHNPVDWYPWGPEALGRASKENRPILVSIGYSACHWCHVMERESFDDPAIAGLMNASFVNIKVDREERPDLDRIYQTAVQLMTRRTGGWPLTVFLTPELKPFYGGTYFPPEDRHGMPGFASVLRSVADAFDQRREEMGSLAQEVVDVLSSLEHNMNKRAVGPDAVIETAQKLATRFDERYGGFGDAPKFPNTLSHDVMLRAHRRSSDKRWLSIVMRSLDAMIDGGIHDQIGGGFHRYSTDARWRIPHFEKMLYDNALIGRLLVDLWRVTRAERYREVAGSLLSYVEREMSAPEGGFYATQDADSEGREGAFFVWTPGELAAVLEPNDADLVARRYGVDAAGNFEDGTTVLHRTRSLGALREQGFGDPAELSDRLDAARRKLFDARELRAKPFRDEKIIAAWNGLMAGTFAEAGAAFGERRFTLRAAAALSFVRKAMWDGGVLFRLWKQGTRGDQHGFLVDYAAIANAALDLYEATFEEEWARYGREVADAAIERFWDSSSDALYFAEDQGDLVLRTQDHFDGETPSGASSFLQALLRLDDLFQEGPYRELADRALPPLIAAAFDNPFSHGHLVGVIDRWVHGPCHVVFSGNQSDVIRSLVRTARSTFVLDRSFVGESATWRGAERALGQQPDEPGAYVCRDRTCTPPICDSAALIRALEER